MSPVCVRLSLSLAALARPKSVTQTLPVSSSSRFDGLMSRCRTPWLAAWARASATCMPTRATLCQYWLPDSLSVDASLWPGKRMVADVSAARTEEGAARSAPAAGAPGALVGSPAGAGGAGRGAAGPRRRRSRRARGVTGRRGRAEGPREQAAGHVPRGDVPRGVGRATRRIALGRRLFAARPPQAAQFVQDRVQAEA